MIDGKKSPEVVYFHVSNLLDAEGKLTETFTGNGSNMRFGLAQHPIGNETTVKVDNIEVTSGVQVLESSAAVFFDEAPLDGSVITVIYTPDSSYTTAKWLYAYTFGTRRVEEWIGSLSVSEGRDNTASAYCSHAEGYEVRAVSEGAHAEGHATKATSPAAHAEGYATEASGYHSHAQNSGTIAGSRAQTALGKYNESDYGDTYAVIIGNGTAENARSNAMTVDWNGNIEIAGTVKNLIVTEQKSTTLSLPASNTATASINMAKTGYTLLGIVGVQPTGSGSSMGYIYGFYVSGNTANVYFRNTTATARSFTVIVTGLYVKS